MGELTLKKIYSFVLSAILTISVVVTGCGNQANQSDGGKTDQGESKNEGTAEVDRAHTLVWSVPATPNGLDHEFHYSLEAMEAEVNMYDSALRYPLRSDESGFLVPDFTKVEGSLAESWEISDDGKVVTVHLRQGVMSHSGNELTADDFIYKQERAWELNGAVKNFGGDGLKLYDLKQLKKIDKYTFQITLDSPNPVSESMLTHLVQHLFDSVEVKAKATAEDPWGAKYMASNGSGHGPYKMVSFKPGQEVVFEAFNDYWDKENAPWFQKVIMKEVPSSANRVALLVSGAVDAATYLTANELKEIEGKPGVKVYHWSSNLIQRVEFNQSKPPFDNGLVRKALSYATPYEEILSSVYMGTAKQAKSIIPSTYPGFTDKFWNYKLDLEKAKELLKQAGYENGFKTTLTINAGIPQEEQIAIILKTSFAKIGVDLEIKKVQTGDYYNQVANHSFEGMYIFQDMPGVVDGAFPIGLWAQNPSTQNIGEYNNEEVNKLYKETTTLDQTKRNQLIERLQEIIVDEDPIWIFLAEPGYHLAMRDDIKNPAWQTLQQIRWNNLTRN